VHQVDFFLHDYIERHSQQNIKYVPAIDNRGSQMTICSINNRDSHTIFADMSLNRIQQFQCTTIYFFVFKKKSVSRNELYNIASNVAYYQIHVAYFF